MLWYLMQLTCQRYQHWDLHRQLKKLGIQSMPSVGLEEVAAQVAKPLFADCRDSEEKEFVILLTHIAYGFAARPKHEGMESVKSVIAAMGQVDEAKRASARDAVYQLMERWRELYPGFLPSKDATYSELHAETIRQPSRRCWAARFCRLVQR